jgi:hypothetical protein
VLGAVAVMLALLILPYFQKWLIQRSQIESARAAVSQSKRDVATLAAQRARWSDDNYVKAQARARLNYVMPGDTNFVMVNPGPEPSQTPPTDRNQPSPSAPAPRNRPWFADIWLSAQVAADPTGTATTSPSPR